MKAFICTSYGPPEVLKLTEVEKPSPKENEILIRIVATTVNAADTRIRGAVFPAMVNLPVRLALGVSGPRKKILGVEIAGVVDSTGSGVKKFKPGDKVFASTGAAFGGYAEFICLPENGVIALKPPGISFEDAAAIPHCALAAHFYLLKGKVSEGKEVLIWGASGGIGTFAVQIAKSMGANVTGVCSTANIELVKSLGADRVIDYTRESLDGVGEIYDVIFDTIGKAPIPACVKSLKKKGLYMSAVHLEFSRIREGIWASLTTGKKVIGGVAAYTPANLEWLGKLAESGKMKSVIDRVYSFEQLPGAHAYVDTGHKKGHVAIRVVNDLAGER